VVARTGAVVEAEAEVEVAAAGGRKLGQLIAHGENILIASDRPVEARRAIPQSTYETTHG
jgi:hypothetical protein